MRSGGYGNVFFPFRSRFNASHRKNRTGNILLSDELPHLRAETGHECPFCEDITRLRDSRWARIMHNLIVINEITTRIDDISREAVIDAMDPQSKYRRRLEEIATQSSPSAAD
jgi:hypothetical protein